MTKKKFFNASNKKLDIYIKIKKFKNYNKENMTIYFRIEMRIKGRNKIVINKNCSIYIDNEK